MEEIGRARWAIDAEVELKTSTYLDVADDPSVGKAGKLCCLVVAIEPYDVADLWMLWR